MQDMREGSSLAEEIPNLEAAYARIEELTQQRDNLLAERNDALDRLTKSINRHNAERDDLLAALEAGVSEADRTHMAFLWHGKIWADEARALLTRIKHPKGDTR